MTRRPGWLAPTALLLAGLLAGCESVASTHPAGTAGALASSAATAGTSTAPPDESTGPEATDAPTCAQSTLDSMSLGQRVGQLFMVKLPTLAVGATIRDAIATWHIGNVWYGRTTIGIDAIRSVSDALQNLATDGATAEVPLFISANQEGGGGTGGTDIQGLQGPGFETIPTALTQGTWSTDQLQTQAGEWGSDLGDAGVNMDFAPVADVVPAGTASQNAPIGKLHREFGGQPGPVADHVTAFINGMHDAGIATTAKHFPGLGRVVGNTDNTAAVVDTVTTRNDPFLEPFRAAVQDAQTEFVMISLATYTKIDASHLAAFSSIVMQDMLRGDLGFDGVIASDSLSATAVISLTPAMRAVRFLEAGGDLIVLTPISTAITMVKAVTGRATSNATFRAIVDAAALRVLEAKDEAGLLPCS
jgi:beta-N-acetylhexosaminidase